jgi:hypothetical protein
MLLFNSATDSASWQASMSDWTLWSMTKPLTIRSVVELFDFKTQEKIQEAEPPETEEPILEEDKAFVLYCVRWKWGYWYTTDRDEAEKTAREISDKEPVIVVGLLRKESIPGTVGLYCLHNQGSAFRLQISTDLEKLKEVAKSLEHPVLVLMGYVLPGDCPDRGTVPLHHAIVARHHEDYNYYATDEEDLRQVQKEVRQVITIAGYRFEYIRVAAYIYPPPPLD